MNVFYEEDGGFKVGSVLADNVTSLQVEAAHGKRSKIKANAVMLRFDQPALATFMAAAEVVGDGLDLDFLWEVAPQDEFDYAALGKDYFGHAPSPVEAAGLLLRLHGSPMHFYKKGKGRYRPAPPEALKAALAGVERKRLQAQAQAGFTAALVRFELPDALCDKLDMLLYEPDKGAIEFKALEAASAITGLSAVHLLNRCGAFASSHDYHFNRFLREHFPSGTGWRDVPETIEPDGLPLAPVRAFSIDDVTTTEIDDALSVTPLAAGGWRIGIHIAAPVLGIEPGSPLDLKASRRLSTVYMPGSKITMLPDAVIDRFTLREGRVRPVVSLYALVDADLAPIGFETCIERVSIAANLRIDDLDVLFNPETIAAGRTDFPFGHELHLLWRLAVRLEAARGKADGPADRQDYSFYVEDDRVRIVERKRGTPVDKLVAEMMILANSEWGRQLATADAAAIYRVQSHGKTRLSTAPGPHEGLGVAQYAWSSSPLRRYVDLVNQRQIVALARGEELPYPRASEQVTIAMRDFELAYDAFAEFQRGMEKYWCLRWVQQESAFELPATVIRESLVRTGRIPLVARCPSLPPEIGPGTAIHVELGGIDLLTLDFDCVFRGKRDPAPALA